MKKISNMLCFAIIITTILIATTTEAGGKKKRWKDRVEDRLGDNEKCMACVKNCQGFIVYDEITNWPADNRKLIIAKVTKLLYEEYTEMKAEYDLAEDIYKDWKKDSANRGQDYSGTRYVKPIKPLFKIITTKIYREDEVEDMLLLEKNIEAYNKKAASSNEKLQLKIAELLGSDGKGELVDFVGELGKYFDMKPWTDNDKEERE